MFTWDPKWNFISPWKKLSLHHFFSRTKWNEIHFCFDLLNHYLCFYKIFACADISFWMISFRSSIYITFITRNEISFLSKWNNTSAVSFISQYWPDTELKIFRFARNEISCKHPFSWKLKSEIICLWYTIKWH